MATVKTPRLNLAKQAAGDNPGSWEVDINQGFDDADARFFRTGAVDPDGVEDSDYIGQRYQDTVTELWYTATDAASPGAWTKDFDTIDPLVTHPTPATSLAQDYQHGHLIGILDNPTLSTVRMRPLGGTTGYVDISGGRETWTGDFTWDISDAGHREGAQTEDPSKAYYLYFDNDTTPATLLPIISTTPPDDIDGTKPGYHPTLADHRCVGSVWQNANSDIVKSLWQPGGVVMFTEHDADHTPTVNGAATASWRNLPVNLPLTALDIRLTISGTRGAGAVGGVIVGADGATGTIGGGDLTTPAGMKHVLMHSITTGAGDFSGASVQGVVPIVTPATPAISYAVTAVTLNTFFMAVTGYRDRWAPKGF